MADPASYRINKPGAADLLSVSQFDIQNNFDANATWIQQNHVTYASGAVQAGKHTFVQMPVQVGVPTGGFLDGEGALFTRASAVTVRPELVFARGTEAPYEISTYATDTYTFNHALQGVITYSFVWTRLPSGLLQIWGTQTTFGPEFKPTGLIIEFPTLTSFPGFTTAVYNVQVTLQWNDANGGNGNQGILLVQGGTSIAQFQITRESQNSYSTKGSISFSAIGI